MQRLLDTLQQLHLRANGGNQSQPSERAGLWTMWPSSDRGSGDRRINREGMEQQCHNRSAVGCLEIRRRKKEHKMVKYRAKHTSHVTLLIFSFNLCRRSTDQHWRHQRQRTGVYSHKVNIRWVYIWDCVRWRLSTPDPPTPLLLVSHINKDDLFNHI